jgi:hypothetical protein
MNKPEKPGTFKRKQQLTFFLGVYVSPFVAMYLWTAYGLIIGKFPFTTLLLGVIGICGSWGGLLFAYHSAQPHLQRWRVERAVKRELLSTRRAVKQSPS